MTPRTKTVSLVAALALLLVGGYWLLHRSRPATPKAPSAQSAEVAAPAPAVAAQGPADATAPARATAPAAITQTPSPVALPVQPVSTLQPSIPVAAPAPPAPSPLTFTPSPRERQASEIAATARMYAAHAPLRTPEVADPDSKANKQILGTMVAKMLAQPATPPQQNAPAKN